MQTVRKFGWIILVLLLFMATVCSLTQKREPLHYYLYCFYSDNTQYYYCPIGYLKK